MSSLAAVPSARLIIYPGMEVHKDSITVAVLPAAAKAPMRLDRLANDFPKLKRWLDRLAREGGARVPRGERHRIRALSGAARLGLRV